MIASYSRNFIFLKTRKTGGTSAEIVLSTWCSGHDICTPISPEDEIIRGQFGGRAMNFSARFYNHMSAKKVRESLPELWADAFKFTVERHPYEKAVSLAWWNIGRPGAAHREFTTELQAVIEKGTFLNFPLYTIEGRVAVDEVILYDQLWKRLGELGKERGLSIPATLPRAKARFRQDRQPASDILSHAQKEQIFQKAKFEFDLLGFAR